MNKYRRTLINSVAVVAVSIAAALSPASAKDLSAQLQQMATAVNAQLPKMMDKITRLDHLEAGPGNTLTYDFTLVPFASDAATAQKFAAAAPQYVTGRACSNPSVTRLLKMGVTMDYVYKGNDGKEITSFAIHASDCGS